MLEELRGLKTVDEQRAWFLKYVINNMRGANPGHPPFYAGPETTKSAWQDVQLKAVRNNIPARQVHDAGRLRMDGAPNGGNMHRNVIFRDTDRAGHAASAARHQRRGEALGLDGRAGANAASKLFAIPHNSNGSKG